VEIRDPVLGAVYLSSDEAAVVEHPWVQRLRHIGQTGFTRLAFPGATHSRFLHSLGVCHLAGVAFDNAYRKWSFESSDARERFRGVVRVAALCHDLGHPPFSHCTEFSMPSLGALGVSWYSRADPDRRATHEDYTIAILEHSQLGQVIAERFGFTARHVGALIASDISVPDGFFHDGGLDHRRLLSQIISSELDVDRLDYLVRDAEYTGAQYGRVDRDWLLGNLSAHVRDGSVCLALRGRAVYAFDHFLLARHHMFLQVYFHHKSVIYEEMLKRWVLSDDCDWALPAALDAYFRVDDVSLTQHLRAVTHPMARRVAERRPYRRALERHGTRREADVSADQRRLETQGIDVISAASTGRLSRYDAFGRKRRSAPPIYVVDAFRADGRVRDLAEVSQVFRRYADERCIARLYVPPEGVEQARAILGLG
jgi:HD superfamily phosphohydrolase